MIYRLPEKMDEELLQAYVQEHYDHQETDISACARLTSTDYASWVDKIHRNATVGGTQWGKSLLYLCFAGDTLVGLLNIRYDLPENLTNLYGDIGYGVRPTERNKGYATEMLRHALSVCREKGMDRVILGCYQDNLASAATIKKNGGILIGENDALEAGRISQYYAIKL